MINGDSADKLVVSARTSGEVDSESGITLFLVDADAAGVTRRGYGTVDGGRAAEITLDGVRVPDDAVIAKTGKGFAVIEATYARGIAALVAEAFGAMEVSRNLTLD